MKLLRKPYLGVAFGSAMMMIAFQNCSQQYGVVASTDPTRQNPSAGNAAGGSDAGNDGRVELPEHSFVDAGNPNQVDSNGNSEATNSNSNQSSAGAIGSVDAPDPVVVNSPSQVVCDPLAGGGQNLSSRRGLKAELFTRLNAANSVGDFFRGADRVDDTLLVLSKVDVPTRSFQEGFQTTSGHTLKNSKGELLMENFGLKIDGKLKLTDLDSEGLYQFALISDDGAILELNTGRGLEKVVDNDGTHPAQAKCGSLIQLRKGVAVPLRISYYQGPRYHIALTLMWRKLGPGQSILSGDACELVKLGKLPDEKECYQGTEPYKRLLSRDWKVVPEENFVSDETTSSLCQ